MKSHISSAILSMTAAAITFGFFTGMPSAANGAGLVQPDISAMETFVVTPPYSVLVQGQPQYISIGGVSRTYDFVTYPFVNPDTKVPDAAVLQSWNPVQSTISGNNITNAGMPNHIEKNSGRLMVGVVAGDYPVAGKCRAQIAGHPVPSRKVAYMDYTVQFGAPDDAGHQWALTTPDASPVLIMQLKAPDAVNPALAMTVDTDTLDPSRLMIFFGYKGGNATKCLRVGEAHKLDRYTPVRIVMEAFLDERETMEGGHGYWRVWVNGQLVVSVDGPTLSGPSLLPHQLMLNAYEYNDPCPNNLNRFTYWDRAKIAIK